MLTPWQRNQGDRYVWDLSDEAQRNDIANIVAEKKPLWVEGLSRGLGNIRVELHLGNDNPLEDAFLVNVKKGLAHLRTVATTESENDVVFPKVASIDKLRQFDGGDDVMLGMSFAAFGPITPFYGPPEYEDLTYSNDSNFPAEWTALEALMVMDGIEIFVTREITLSTPNFYPAAAIQRNGRIAIDSDVEDDVTLGHEFAHEVGIEEHLCEVDNFMIGEGCPNFAEHGKKVKQEQHDELFDYYGL